jgi:hypothetical protein
MADDASNIITLRPPLRVVEQSSSGRFDFDTVPLIDVTGGTTTTGRIFIRGKLYHEGTLSNCARIAALLNELHALGGRLPEPTLRQMLERSLNSQED